MTLFTAASRAARSPRYAAVASGSAAATTRGSVTHCLRARERAARLVMLAQQGARFEQRQALFEVLHGGELLAAFGGHFGDAGGNVSEAATEQRRRFGEQAKIAARRSQRAIARHVFDAPQSSRRRSSLRMSSRPAWPVRARCVPPQGWRSNPSISMARRIPSRSTFLRMPCFG